PSCWRTPPSPPRWRSGCAHDGARRRDVIYSAEPMSLGRALPCLALSGSLLLCGCRSDPAQVAVVQEMSTALTRKKAAGIGTICNYLVPEQENPMGCDSLVIQLLHYAPAFPGSQVSRRARSSGGPLMFLFMDRPIRVPVHYEGKNGSGNLDVMMRNVKGKW